MCKPVTDVFATTRQADSLTRADELEREFTDLCAQIDTASCKRSAPRRTRNAAGEMKMQRMTLPR